jgi:hypothetical protein
MRIHQMKFGSSGCPVLVLRDESGNQIIEAWLPSHFAESPLPWTEQALGHHYGESFAPLRLYGEGSLTRLSVVGCIHQERPQMRRKSSAGTLLSFRSPSSASTNAMASTATIPPHPSPLVVAMGGVSAPSQSSATAHSPDRMSSPGASATPTMREWDSQSASGYSEGHAPAPVGAGVGTLDLWRDTINKRIMTLTYLRSTHEGCVFLETLATSCRERCSSSHNNN